MSEETESDMINSLKQTFFGCMALAVLLLSASNLFGGIRIKEPETVYYHRFASAVSGPEAIWVNPAGLGLNKKLNIQYIARFYDGDFTGDWGSVMSGDGIGISYRSVENFEGGHYNEYIYGAGFGVSGGLFVGGSYRYIKKGFEYLNKRHFWNIGFIYSNHPQFRLAAVYSNLNRSEADGEKTDLKQLYAVSYNTVDHKFTISVEMSLFSNQSLSGAKYNYGIDWQVKPNIKIYANYNNDKYYQIGFKLDLKNYFFGTQSRGEAENNKHLGTSVYTGYVKSLTRQ